MKTSILKLAVAVSLFSSAFGEEATAADPRSAVVASLNTVKVDTPETRAAGQATVESSTVATVKAKPKAKAKAKKKAKKKQRHAKRRSVRKNAAALTPEQKKRKEREALRTCRAKPEICGDKIDQDCNGKDLACPAGSKPPATNPPPASNPIPPVNPPSRPNEPSGSPAQTADCEATGSGRCFYIAGNGNDNNPGTLAAPWRSYRKLISYYDGNTRPAGWHRLGPGDVVYFRTGTYSDTYQYNREVKGFFLRGVRGTASAPILIKAFRSERPKFSLPNHTAIDVYQSESVILDGFEVVGSKGAGVMIGESRNIEMRNLWVHDTHGSDDNNIAGVYIVDSNGVRLHHSVVNDNYDRSNASNGGVKAENSRNVVLFRGGNARIDHNNIYNTPSIEDQKRGGACIGYKHSQTVPGGIFEVDHNTFSNCSFASVATGTYNSFIHHNFTLNSAPFLVQNLGGETHQVNIQIDKNTIVGNSGLAVFPDLQFGPFGPVYFRGNIVIDPFSYGFDYRGIVRITPYGNDSLYDLVVRQKAVQINDNCYFNPSAQLVFSAFAANGGSNGSRGGLFDMNGWRNLGYDTSSLSANPNLSATFLPQNAACLTRGWLAN